MNYYLLFSFLLLQLNLDYNHKKLIQEIEFNYELILESCSNCAPTTNNGYFIYLTDIDSISLTHLSTIEPKEWLIILTDSSLMWKSNLILYHLYRKDAMNYFYLDSFNQEIWESDYMDEDIEYWISKFSSKN